MPTAGVEGWLRFSMMVCLACCVGAGVLRAFDLALLDGIHPGRLIGEAYLGLTGLAWSVLNVASTAALLAGAATLSWWVALTVRNTESLVRGPIRSQWWSWVWFWVPGPWFWRPVTVLSELLAISRFGVERVRGGYSQRHSVDARARLDRVSPLAAAWWLSVLAWQAAFRGGEALIVHGPIEGLALPGDAGAWLSLAGYALGVAASALSIVIVRRIGAMQREWDQRTPKSESAEAQKDRTQMVSPVRTDIAA
jgi:hypothetical protein